MTLKYKEYIMNKNNIFRNIALCATFATIPAVGITLQGCDDHEQTQEELGKPCHGDTYQPKCVGNQIFYCDHVVKASACDGVCVEFHSHKNCETENGECLETTASTTPSCKTDEDKCSIENETKKGCVKSISGSTSVKTFRCEKPVSTEQLYYRSIESESCYEGYGVCTEAGECTEPVYCADDYVAHCKDNISYTCHQNRLREADCGAYSSPHQCKMVDGDAECLADDDKCTKEGEERIVSCNASSQKEFVDVCTAVEDGSLYYIREGSRNCMSGCNTEGTACAAASCDTVGAEMKKCRESTSTTYEDIYTCNDVDGEKQWVLKENAKCDNGKGTCDADGNCVPAETCVKTEFDSRCDHNIALTCSGKKVKREQCSLYSTPRTCEVIDDTADCYDADDVCTNEGQEIVERCVQTTGKERLLVCKKAESGKLYYVSNGTRDCPKGCNAEGTACAE